MISVVIPTLNAEANLAATLTSLVPAAVEGLVREVIVVDGGSQDGSREIIQRYAHRLAGWVSEKDQGLTDAINKGFARANGEILAWLNSDDTYEPGTVRQVVDHLLANPEDGMVYGDAN